jgi:hypothetical protein
MKARIDPNGFLSIERGREFKVQYCMHDNRRMCSDFCPAFGEPYGKSNASTGEPLAAGTFRCLPLGCIDGAGEYTQITGEIIDERPQK